MSEKRQKAADELFCTSCGEIIKAAAEICPHCGVRQKSNSSSGPNVSDKSRLVAFLLVFFLGFFGAHRFYVGKIGSGVAMIFLAWLTLGIWPLVDLILILCGRFTDEQGKLVTNWSD